MADLFKSSAWTALEGFLQQLLNWLPFLGVGIFIITVGWFVASLSSRIINRILLKTGLRESLRELVVKLEYVIVLLVGILAGAVVTTGLEVGQVVATLGLGSIALGFAFKDIIENFLAGIIILWKFPYDAGDFIECEGITGRVENIELRMTLIRRTDGVLDLIPNAMMFKNPVKVLTNRPIRRMTVMCGVAYGEDVAESRKVIKQAVEACTSIDKSNPVEIFAQEFGASSIDFEVTWWCGSTPLQVRESRDEVVEAVKKALDDAGIEIPYPYRTLTFTKNEPDIINAVAGRSGNANDHADGHDS